MGVILRFLVTLRYSVVIVMIAGIAACGGAQPIPTAIIITATPADTAVAVVDVQPTQPAVETRTPLPSLTPTTAANTSVVPTTDPQATVPAAATTQPIATTAVATSAGPT